MVYIIIGIILGIILIYCIVGFFLAFRLHAAVFGKRTDVNPLVKYYTKEQFGLNSRKYDVNMEGTKLSGNLYYYENYKENAIVIFAHGMGTPTKAYLQDIEFIARQGYLVLGFDYYGVDESEGNSITGFSMGLKSLDYVIKKVIADAEFKNADIYLAGHSWGAYNCLSVLPLNKGRIKAVAVLAPFQTMEGAVLQLNKKAWMTLPFIRLVEFFKCGKYAFYNAKKGVKQDVPVLIIHSVDDPMVSYPRNALKFQRNKNVKLVTVNQKKHNPDYTEEAVKKLYDFYAKVSSLKGEELLYYMKNVNYNELGAIDEEVLSQITAFFK